MSERLVDIMTMKKCILMTAPVVFFMLIVAGCAGEQDPAQNAYDHNMSVIFDQLAVVNNISAQWTQIEDILQLKALLIDYRSNLTILQDDMNLTYQAGAALKKNLDKGSSEYATVLDNEQKMREYFELYVTDYNRHATSYNNAPGQQYGTVPLF